MVAAFYRLPRTQALEIVGGAQEFPFEGYVVKTSQQELAQHHHQLRVGDSLGGLFLLLRTKVAAPFARISRAHCHVEIDVVCKHACRRAPIRSRLLVCPP
jgi:hypothetical protein